MRYFSDVFVILEACARKLCAEIFPDTLPQKIHQADDRIQKWTYEEQNKPNPIALVYSDSSKSDESDDDARYHHERIGQ